MSRLRSYDEQSWAVAVGAQVAQARRALGLTQRELADTLGMSRSMLAMFETGQNGISAYQLLRIIEQLGVTDVMPISEPDTEVSKRCRAQQVEIRRLRQVLDQVRELTADAG